MKTLGVTASAPWLPSRLLRLLKRRGMRYPWYLVRRVLLPRLVHRIPGLVPVRLLSWIRPSRIGALGGLLTLLAASWFGSKLLVLLLIVMGVFCEVARRRLQQVGMANKERDARALTDAAGLSGERPGFTLWEQLDVAPTVRESVKAKLATVEGAEVVLGRVDQDGRLLGLFGELPGLEPVSAQEFVERIRYQLHVVLREGRVLVKKDFRGDRGGFVREWHALARLASKANVPAIYDACPQDYSLYIDYIPGRTMRDVLVNAGARIRDYQVRDDPELSALGPAQRQRAVEARGTALTPSCFTEQFLIDVEQQLENIHRAGVAGLDIKFGNVIIHARSGAPMFVDFETAQVFESKDDLGFLYKRNRDLVKFNRAFGRSLLTEASARRLLQEQKAKLVPDDPGSGDWYAPLDFGGGLTVGRFWAVDSGMGRWEFLNGSVLDGMVRGKRVLDLGSNVGAMPLMMLRAGATEVVGIEMSPPYVEIADALRRIFEWRDMRTYRLDVRNANMLEILEGDWGKFDVVTALCSLYYLTPDDMARVVRNAAERAPTMVLQGNVLESPGGDTREKASPAFLKQLLEDNGFPFVEVHWPPGFSRPLLVGTKLRQSSRPSPEHLTRQEELNRTVDPRNPATVPEAGAEDQPALFNR